MFSVAEVRGCHVLPQRTRGGGLLRGDERGAEEVQRVDRDAKRLFVWMILLTMERTQDNLKDTPFRGIHHVLPPLYLPVVLSEERDVQVGLVRRAVNNHVAVGLQGVRASRGQRAH